MRKDVKGHKLYKKLTVKVLFPPDVFPEKIFVQKAPAGKGFHAAGIEEMLENLAEQLDTLYPFWNFTSIEMSPIGSTARYVFAFAGYNIQATTETDSKNATAISDYLRDNPITEGKPLTLELPIINNDSADAPAAAETQNDSATQEQAI